MVSDDIVTRCKGCFNLSNYCSCPHHQQVNDRRRAVEAQKDMKCAMYCEIGLSGAPIHPDYYKWWENKGKPNSKQLSEIISASREILDCYVQKYGEGQ